MKCFKPGLRPLARPQLLPGSRSWWGALLLGQLPPRLPGGRLHDCLDRGDHHHLGHLASLGFVPTVRLKKPEHEPPLWPGKHPGARQVDRTGLFDHIFFKVLWNLPFLGERRVQVKSSELHSFITHAFSSPFSCSQEGGDTLTGHGLSKSLLPMCIPPSLFLPPWPPSGFRKVS